VDDVDVRFSVIALVRAIDTVVLQPLNVRLRVAENTALEYGRLSDLHRRIAWSFVNNRLMRIDSYTEQLYLRISKTFQANNIRSWDSASLHICFVRYGATVSQDRYTRHVSIIYRSIDYCVNSKRKQMTQN